jgi:hypothetical protein
MTTLVWHAPTRYYSASDEAAFFTWLQAIPGVLSVRGIGRELHITLRSKRLSVHALRELLALYRRYGGNMRELAVFANPSNEDWFKATGTYWHRRVFGSHVDA